MTSFGFSDEAARLFEEMYTAFAKGTIVYEFPNALVRGTISLAEAVRGWPKKEAVMHTETIGTKGTGRCLSARFSSYGGRWISGPQYDSRRRC